MKHFGSWLGLLGLLFIGRQPAAGQLCSELRSEILQIIVNETDIRPEDTPGYAVGVVAGDSTCFFGFGSARKDSTLPLRPDHVFEIGGLTTLFTAALLRILESEGTMPLDSPLNHFLPPEWHNPNTGALSLRRFLMHTSGLPRLPEGIGKTQRHENDPFADYPPESLGRWFASFEPPEEDPPYSYSHVNYALLELAAEHATGRPFESLMEEKLFRPLGMEDTGFTLRPEQRARLLPGYDKGAQPTPPWQFRSFRGALGLKSTAEDLLRFLQILMGVKPHPLTPLLQTLDDDSVETGMRNHTFAGLGWHIIQVRGRFRVWALSGATGGHRAYLACVPQTKTGVLVFANAPHGLDGLGFLTLRLLNHGWRRKALK